MLTALLCHTPPQSWPHQVRHGWSRSKSHRPWWWSHLPEELHHLRKQLSEVKKETGKVLNCYKPKQNGGLTCKEATVIHFLQLFSLFHFFIHFLFFSPDSKTHKTLSWHYINVMKLKWLIILFVLPPFLLQWFRYNILWGPKILHGQQLLLFEDTLFSLYIRILYIWFSTYWVSETET